MNITLLPLYFNPGRDANFDIHLDLVKTFLKEEADFLDPVPVGGDLPDADAAIFPQMLGEAHQ